MERRIGRKRFSIYALDLETHADKESIEANETSMWLGCFINEESRLEDPESFFYTMDEFLDRVEAMTSRKRTKKARPCVNFMAYVWNLAFEWSFILPALFARGFKAVTHIEKDDEYVFSSVTTKTCSSVWTATIKFGKRGGVLVLKDLKKILPAGSLRNAAKSFALETQKGDIDYTLDRRNGWVVTDEEREYNFKDTKIIMEILQEMDRRDDKEFWACVSAASYTCKKMLRETYPWAYRPMKQYRKEYPALAPDVNHFLRKSVEGGITYAVDSWQFKTVEKVGHIDIHQAHPASLTGRGGRKGIPYEVEAPNGLFPYGEPTYHRGKPFPHHYKMACVHCLISYSGVKLHAKVQLIGLDLVTDYEITLWDFEIPLLEQCYDNFRIKYIDYYEFKTRKLPFAKYFEENYEKRKVAKANKDAFGILYYKLLNNSAYGKFLERGHDVEFLNKITEDGYLDSDVIKSKTCLDEDSNATYTYIGIGSVTPAWTRVRLVGTALYLGYENVLYFDTDSIFYRSTPETEAKVDRLNLEDELGGWSREDYIRKAQFDAPKRYKLELEATNEFGEHILDVKAAGVSAIEGINTTVIEGLDGRPYIKARTMGFDDVNLVNGVYPAHSKKRAKGGTLIVDVAKQMQVQDKYLDTYRKNVLESKRGK